jgi:hypothetical protein
MLCGESPTCRRIEEESAGSSLLSSNL